ncbi:MAG: GtrA family protein, partial [Acidobacteriota bacterium]|nr:GtrA family protein [Acidobacteriota bacterium]
GGEGALTTRREEPRSMSADPAQIQPTVDSPPAAAWRSALAHPFAPVLAQFLRFAVVGVSNTALTLVIYTVLERAFGVWYLLASAIGFIAGATNGFLLNRRWTFRGHRGDALTPLRWTTVQGAGLALDELLLYLGVHEAGLDSLLAQALAVGIVVVLTFLANRAWTFRMSEAP